MKVLLSGAFGNVGESTLKELLKKGYDVRCFDLKNPRNARIRNKVSKYGNFEVIWGDIRDKETVNNLVQGIDCIIHLASIIPPLAYEQPKLAYEVNVQGTKNLINAAEKMENLPKFIYSSSIAVHGNTMNKKPPTKINDSFKPLDYDNYAKHKIEIEQTLWASRLPWIILRFAAITPFDMKWDIPDIMFEIPLKQRIEIADTRDVGLACSNAVKADIVGKTLFIGGGKGNQLLQREYVSKMLDVMGIGMLPEEAFKPVNDIDDFYHCDWMETEESQQVLKFQRYTFEDFLNKFKKRKWFMRFIISMFKPIVRAVLLKKSPYYKKLKEKDHTPRKRRKPKPSFS